MSYRRHIDLAYSLHAAMIIVIVSYFLTRGVMNKISVRTISTTCRRGMPGRAVDTGHRRLSRHADHRVIL